MVFSSPTFLFLFLPLVLALYVTLGRRARNPVLLLASLFFYAWGERFLVAIMLASIAANYGFGLWIEGTRRRGGGTLAVSAAVAFNLGLLVVFKYANWAWDQLSALLDAAGIVAGGLPREWEIRLPIGISFFTFQALSYVVDVHRGTVAAQRNPLHFGTYIALFPQLIAGPIVRYADIARELVDRRLDLAGAAWGVRRFVVGLAKKMLLANSAGAVADSIFALPETDLTASAAWLGAVCYALQIYFDFSGYSDMAIGLGRMLGFRFLENFRYPYVARSITDFWRRWHISLSSWFRDYLYIPLGGNRSGRARTYRNLLIVFFLCGLWHGAAWTFVLWGLYHGGFLVLERLGLGALLERRHAVLRHAYVLVVVLVGWVLFRAESAAQAATFLGAMAGLGAAATGYHSAGHYLDAQLLWTLAIGAVACTPILGSIDAWRRGLSVPGARRAVEALALVLVALLFVGSSLELAAGTYNPFIYYRF